MRHGLEADNGTDSPTPMVMLKGVRLEYPRFLGLLS